MTRIPDDVREIAQRAYNYWLEGGNSDLREVIASAIMTDRQTGHPVQKSQIGMTSRQRQTLTYITEYHAANGFMPSYEEVKTALGLASKSGVHRLVHALVERGAIETLPNRARAFRLPVAAPQLGNYQREGPSLLAATA